jgi:hypothetical protein
MAKFTELLAAGDTRSDGLANEVVRLVLASPILLPELVLELGSDGAAVRAHAADALEKVARVRAEDVSAHLSTIATAARQDEVPMVRWHMAMVLEHICRSTEEAGVVVETLSFLLRDRSPFVRSWAVSGLTVLARRSLVATPRLIRAIAPLTSDPSAAVAKRARTAMRVLTDPTFPVPSSWQKARS